MAAFGPLRQSLDCRVGSPSPERDVTLRRIPIACRITLDQDMVSRFDDRSDANAKSLPTDFAIHVQLERKSTEF